MKFFVDSYAWIEYLDGSPKGEKVKEILINNEVYTLSLNISEVISRVKRKNGNIEIAYNAIISNAKIIIVEPKLAKEAGLFHAKIKSKIKDFGLMDALIFVGAKSVGAKILTGDPHFKNFKETLLL
jgi:predicted nucleic acid-binding protein